MLLPLILFGLVCATLAVAGLRDKAQYRRKIAEQETQLNKRSD